MGGAHHHHHHHTEGNPGDDRYRAMQRVTVIGAVVNLVLAAVKIVVGYLGQSQALVADGVHSLSDLATDAMVLFAARHGSKEADEDHPYGHGRIETAFTVALGAFLILVAAGIAWDAAERLFHPEELLMPGMLAMAGAVFSVVANEGLYHYTMHVAKQVRSNLLRANAWHHRSDAISSVVVIIGIGGTMAGLPYLDAVAAVGVALMIAKIGWDLLWSSVHELVDTALDPERVEVIRQEVMSVGGVRELHMLRTRQMGGEALVDVHVIVDPKLSVSEGHYIGEKVRRRLIEEVDEVADVMVHIDPEDDEKMAPSLHLPNRAWVEQELHQRWQGLTIASRISRLNLHYLDGLLDVELCLPGEVVPQNEAQYLEFSQLVTRAEEMDEIRSVELYFEGAQK